MRIVNLLIIGMTLIITGCSNDNNGPSESELMNKIQMLSPAFIAIEDLDISATENAGTQVEPKIKSRFEADGNLKVSLYKRKQYILGKHILSETAKEGAEFKVFGIASSTLKLDKWNITFDKIDSTPNYKGYPISKYKEGTYVFEDTQEAKKLLAEAVTKEKERKNTRKKAQKKRLLEQKAKIKADEITKKRVNKKLKKLYSRKLTLHGISKRSNRKFSLYLMPTSNGFVGDIVFENKRDGKLKAVKASHIMDKKMLYLEFKGYKTYMTLTLNKKETKLVGALREAQYNYGVTIDL